MILSFGIEFESDLINMHGERVYAKYDIHRYVRDNFTRYNWDYQDDQTAGIEIRSPIFVSVEDAIDKIKSFFTALFEYMPNLSFYSYNSPGRSIGQHIHIGLYDSILSVSQKRKIAYAIAKIYPYLASMHANPLPSRRGLTSSFCYSISRVDYNIPHQDHYCEISSNPIGTVEFRIFDSNIPQISLVCSWIMLNIAQKALNTTLERLRNIDFSEYDTERANALTYGSLALNIVKYLRNIRQIIGSCELPNIESIKEILYLNCRYGLTPYHIYNSIKPKAFYYFRKMFANPDKYISNLLDIEEHVQNKNLLRRLENVKEKANELDNIDQLIGLALSSIEGLSKLASRMVDRFQEGQCTTISRLSRSMVRECIESNAYTISRLNEVPGLNEIEVANRVSTLLRTEGDNLVRVLNPREIIEANERFYVFAVYPSWNRTPHIVGCIAVRVSSGEVGYLVVDRRYRRMGIAKKLIQHVIQVLRERGNVRPYCRVRKNNNECLSLLQNLGFRIVSINEGTYLLEYNVVGEM